MFEKYKESLQWNYLPLGGTVSIKPKNSVSSKCGRGNYLEVGAIKLLCVSLMQKMFGRSKGGCFLEVEEQNTEFCEFKTVEETETVIYGKLLH